MKGQITQYNASRGFGLLKVEDRREPLFFHISELAREQHDLIAEGLWAEFDLGARSDGREHATNIRLLLEEDIATGGWACVLVDEAGDWSSIEADQDRAIVLAFLPSSQTLSELVQHHGALLKTFHAAETGQTRAEQFGQMGQLVQHLIATQKAAFAVGRIPAPRWPRVKSMGTSLWAAMIARLVAVYLPFVRGRAWVAIEDRVVTGDLWNFYRHELRGRLADACYMLNRPDCAQTDTWLRLCVYSKKLAAFSQHEGQVSTVAEDSLRLEYRWSPDAGGADPIPIENIRCGLSLPDFVGNVMVSGSTRDARQWRERLQGKVGKIDLTEFRL